MNLTQAIRRECCSVDLKAKSKDEVLRALAKLACRCPAAEAVGADVIYERLCEREQQGSTGFGNGVAIPHARVEGMEEFVIGIGVTPRAIDFDALDSKKSRLFFFIIGPPEDPGAHLRALAGISRQTSSARLRQEMLRSGNPAVLFESFARRLQDAPGGAGAERPAMKLMILVLFIEELIYDVLQLLIDEGIDGATILNSSGMAKYISNVPLFAEFIGFMQPRKENSQTLVALIPADREARIVEQIETLTGDLDEKQGAFLVTLNASFYKGSMRML